MTKRVRLVAALLLLSLSCLAVNINQFASAQAITVNNSTATAIAAGIANTTTVQMYIRPSSTAQIFTLTFPNGTAVEVPSGATLTLRLGTNLVAGDAIGTVLTATGSAVLQVIYFREVKQ